MILTILQEFRKGDYIKDKLIELDNWDIIPITKITYPKNFLFDKTKSIEENKQIVIQHNQKIKDAKEHNNKIFNEAKDIFKSNMISEIIKYSNGKLNKQQANLIFDKIDINYFADLKIAEKNFINEIEYAIKLLSCK